MKRIIKKYLKDTENNANPLNNLLVRNDSKENTLSLKERLMSSRTGYFKDKDMQHLLSEKSDSLLRSSRYIKEALEHTITIENQKQESEINESNITVKREDSQTSYIHTHKTEEINILAKNIRSCRFCMIIKVREFII